MATINLLQWVQSETNREKLTEKAEFHALKAWHNALETEEEKRQEEAQKEKLARIG